VHERWRRLPDGRERFGFGLRESDWHGHDDPATGRAGPHPGRPEGERVDLTMPRFSDPTNITNPLFPVSLQESVLMLGHVEGKPFRTEVTLLPETRVIEWEGQRVETLVSQYNAFLDGRIEEVAYDY